MTRRERSYLALELQEEVRGTPCPVGECPARLDSDVQCVSLLTGELLRVPHWQRIKAAERGATS